MSPATSPQVFWGAFLVAALVTTWVPCLVGAWLTRLDSREREILLFWLGISLGQVLLFANHCPPGGEVRAADVDRFFASSSVLYGVAFFAQGRLYRGCLYVLGLARFVAAAVLMCAGPFAPLAHGAWQSVSFAAISRHPAEVSRRQSQARGR